MPPKIENIRKSLNEKLIRIVLNSYKLFFIFQSREVEGKNKKWESQDVDMLNTYFRSACQLINTLFRESKRKSEFIFVKLLCFRSYNSHHRGVFLCIECRTMLNRHASLTSEILFKDCARETKRVSATFVESTNSFFRSFHSMIALTLSYWTFKHSLVI